MLLFPRITTLGLLADSSLDAVSSVLLFLRIDDEADGQTATLAPRLLMSSYPSAPPPLSPSSHDESIPI